MWRFEPHDGAMVLGLVMLSVGVGLEFGLPWSLIVMGALSIALAVIGAVRGVEL